MVIILPLTQQYEIRGCYIDINAALDPDYVFINIQKKGCDLSETVKYKLEKPSRYNYHKHDLKNIKNIINSLLDKYGDDSCIIYTSKIIQ